MSAEVIDLSERQDDSLSVEERVARHFENPEQHLTFGEYWSLYPAIVAEIRRRERAELLEFVEDEISVQTLRLLVIDFVQDQCHISVQDQKHALVQRLQRIENQGLESDYHQEVA